MARPTKLTPELLEKAKDYVADYVQYEDVVPTVAGLSLVLGISRETVYAWASALEEDGETLANPEFSDTVSTLQAKQEKELVANGLQSVFNPAITRLMLSSNHNYKERTDHTTKGKELPTPILAAVPDEKDNG